jgi:cytochrome c oxidase subunit 3
MDTAIDKREARKIRAEDMRTNKRKAAKPLLYIGIVSIVMLFAALTSAYIVRADSGNWLVFKLPPITILSTGVIVASSVTMFIAQRAIKKDEYKTTTLGLLLTFALGVVFLMTQLAAWNQLVAKGIYFAGKYSNASGSFLYLIAFMHVLHMAGGFVALFVSLFKTIKKRYSSADYLGLELTATYWHFLDILWVYLFLFLYNYR